MEMVPRNAVADAVAALLVLAERHESQLRAEASCRECLLSAAAEGDLIGLTPENVQGSIRAVCVGV